MRLVPCASNPQFVQVSRAPAKAVSFIRYEIPSDFRYCDEGLWYIHVSRLQDAVDYVSKFCGLEVDVEGLPARITNSLKFENQEDPYSILHVTRSAPLCVIKAAYKAMSLTVHPDQGGTTEQAVQLNKAYTQVLSDHSGRD